MQARAPAREDTGSAQLPLHEQPPLHGIRVVDFGVYLAGPLVGRILCDAGAHVTAVQPPDGPLWARRAPSC